MQRSPDVEFSEGSNVILTGEDLNDPGERFEAKFYKDGTLVQTYTGTIGSNGSLPLGLIKLGQGTYTVELSSGNTTLLPFKATIKESKNKSDSSEFSQKLPNTNSSQSSEIFDSEISRNNIQSESNISEEKLEQSIVSNSPEYIDNNISNIEKNISTNAPLSQIDTKVNTYGESQINESANNISADNVNQNESSPSNFARVDNNKNLNNLSESSSNQQDITNLKDDVSSVQPSAENINQRELNSDKIIFSKSYININQSSISDLNQFIDTITSYPAISDQRLSTDNDKFIPANKALLFYQLPQYVDNVNYNLSEDILGLNQELKTNFFNSITSNQPLSSGQEQFTTSNQPLSSGQKEDIITKNSAINRILYSKIKPNFTSSADNDIILNNLIVSNADQLIRSQSGSLLDYRRLNYQKTNDSVNFDSEYYNSNYQFESDNKNYIDNDIKISRNSLSPFNQANNNFPLAKTFESLPFFISKENYSNNNSLMFTKNPNIIINNSFGKNSNFINLDQGYLFAENNAISYKSNDRKISLENQNEDINNLYRLVQSKLNSNLLFTPDIINNYESINDNDSNIQNLEYLQLPDYDGSFKFNSDDKNTLEIKSDDISAPDEFYQTAANRINLNNVNQIDNVSNFNLNNNVSNLSENLESIYQKLPESFRLYSSKNNLPLINQLDNFIKDQAFKLLDDFSQRQIITAKEELQNKITNLNDFSNDNLKTSQQKPNFGTRIFNKLFARDKKPALENQTQIESQNKVQKAFQEVNKVSLNTTKSLTNMAETSFTKEDQNFEQAVNNQLEFQGIDHNENDFQFGDEDNNLIKKPRITKIEAVEDAEYLDDLRKKRKKLNKIKYLQLGNIPGLRNQSNLNQIIENLLPDDEETSIYKTLVSERNRAKDLTLSEQEQNKIALRKAEHDIQQELKKAIDQNNINTEIIQQKAQDNADQNLISNQNVQSITDTEQVLVKELNKAVEENAIIKENNEQEKRQINQDNEYVLIRELIAERQRFQESLREESENNKASLRRSEEQIQKQILDLIVSNPQSQPSQSKNDPINQIVKTLVERDKRDADQIVIDATKIIQMIQESQPQLGFQEIDEFLLRQKIERELKYEFRQLQVDHEKKMKLIYRRMIEDMYIDLLNS